MNEVRSWFGWTGRTCCPSSRSPIVLEVAHAGPVVVFFASALGVIPTAALMGRATEELAQRSGPGIGGLLNVTFGNAPELIIALFALNAGLHEVVKASIIGSIIGNVLLVLGAAMLVGGAQARQADLLDAPRPPRSRRCCCSPPPRWSCRRSSSSSRASGLPSPGAEIVNYDSTVEQLSAGGGGRPDRSPTSPACSSRCAPTATCSTPTTATTTTRARALVGAQVRHRAGHRRRRRRRHVGDPRRLDLRGRREGIGLSEFFVGVIVVAIVGNAAEHWVAVLRRAPRTRWTSRSTSRSARARRSRCSSRRCSC